MGKASRARREKIRPILEARETEGLVKRARLFDRLKSRGLFKSTPVVVDIQNVYNYIFNIYGGIDAVGEVFSFNESSPSTEWYKRFPEFILPFRRMFFEYRGLKRDRFYGSYGLYATYNADDVMSASYYALDDTDGYDYEISDVMDDSSRPCYSFYTSDNGELQYIDSNGYDDWLSARYAYVIMLTAIMFMTCRNTELIDLAPSPDDSAAYERKFGVPMTKYKVLRVNSMGKRYEREDKPQQQFDIMPLHIRRGNFAHYTDDAPLFGKLTGTFWRPATTVGNAKNGMVVKDYKVSP